MKKLLPAMLALFCCVHMAHSQSYDLTDLVKFKQDTTSRYYISKIKGNQIYIPLDFNSADIKDLSAYREIKGYSILKVELIYSAYKKVENFDQPKLNVDRLLGLKETAPELFNSSLTKWKFIAQTACKNEEEAKQLFHGFVVTYRPEYATAFNGTQIDQIKCTVERYTDPNYGKKIMHSTGYGKPDLAPAPKCMDNELVDIRDSAVISVLNRNKSWKDMAIVCDATGSMTPYITQTLIWLKLNNKATNVKSYTFFNDGDGTPDESKVVGNTGGIYYGNLSVYDSAASLMFKTMMAGSGGDAPENNIEAMIKTLDKNPDCKELVMIADNLANVKDIALLAKLKKPVHIILCGTANGINSEYLNIARATRGSVHTIEQDITDLVKLNEGEYFTFKGQKFKIVKGQFKLVFDM